jgi:fimbrial chaperone protein
MRRRLLLGCLLGTVLGWMPREGRCGALSVTPTRIDLGPGRQTGVVTLRNDASDPVLVQVRTYAWTGPPLGDGMAPTHDLLAVPPMFELGPRDEQVIRVARRSAEAGPREEAYRLLISEVPPAVASSGVRFALRLSLPVVVTPPGARPLPDWSLIRSDGGCVLRLVNRGTAHILIRRLALREASGSTRQRFEDGVYVLAGESADWRLDKAPGRGERLTVEAETSLGKLDVDLPLLGG